MGVNILHQVKVDVWDMGLGEETVTPSLQESRRIWLVEDISTSGGFNLLNFSSLGEWVALSQVSEQHHYQASALPRTHRKPLDSSTSTGKEEQQHSQDHHHVITQDPLCWRQKGEGMQGVGAAEGTWH